MLEMLEMLENCVKVTFSNLCELVPLNHDCPDGKLMKQNASTKENLTNITERNTCLIANLTYNL